MNNYARIQELIEFIEINADKQPSLDEMATHLSLSPFHLQRLFKEWVGISPKKFLQFVTLSNAKNLLQEEGLSLFDAAEETGLSSSSRLHDLFVSIEGMTPGEYRNGGQNLLIEYSVHQSPFGSVVIGSTNRGICILEFLHSNDLAGDQVKMRFPNAEIKFLETEEHRKATSIFKEDWSEIQSIKLHLKGSEFQLKVWRALLNIPSGKLRAYHDIAGQIEQPNASRAVGTAIGSNPIAFLIPCHRVIQKSGHFGGYRWNLTRKKAMIAWEYYKGGVKL